MCGIDKDSFSLHVVMIQVVFKLEFVFKQPVDVKGTAIFNVQIPLINKKVFYFLINTLNQPFGDFNSLSIPKAAATTFNQNVLDTQKPS